MEVRRLDLMAKSLGITTAINAMAPAAARQNPPRDFGDDYNRLRGLVEQMYLHLTPMLPPEVCFPEADSMFTYGTFSEICAYAEQIYQILDVQPDVASEG